MGGASEGDGEPARGPRHARAPARGPRSAAVAGAAVLGFALIVILAVATPWEVLPEPAGGRVPLDAARDFTEAERAREDAYHRRLWPAYLAAMGASFLTAVFLGFTAAGARLVRAVARPLGGGRGWQLVLGTAAVCLAGRLASLPFTVWREKVQRDYGLAVRSWDAFAVDLAKGFGITSGFTLVALAVFYLAAWRFPRWWWAVGAAAGAAMVAAASYLYPLVVEPAFNDFTAMPAGPLRTALLDLAEVDGVEVTEVLVADASKRTSRLNAYVSGFGSSRRIVIYDTTLRRLPPEQIRMIIAHELGHAKRSDVLNGTLAGALGMATGVCVIFVAMSSPALRRRAGLGPGPMPGARRGGFDPSSLALVLGLVTVIMTVTTPVQLLVSRRVEARADVHALNLTRDPATMIAMQRQLSVSNLGELDPSPWVYGLITTHPLGSERIALARTWARLQGVPEPPDLARPARREPRPVAPGPASAPTRVPPSEGTAAPGPPRERTPEP